MPTGPEPAPSAPTCEPGTVSCVEIPFSYGGVHGVVDARCAPMADPEAFGKSIGDLGLPACTAVVRFPAPGYWSLLGWVQLVAMGPPDQPEEWRSDPFDLFEDSTSPYAWFGVTPTLFDAPSRQHDVSLRWRARSFLATTPWDQDERLVAHLAGFEWGYDLDPTGAVVVRRPVELPRTVWQTHLPYLRARFDRWSFLVDTDG